MNIELTLARIGRRKLLALLLCGTFAACQSGKTEGQKSVENLSAHIDKFAKTLEKSQTELDACLTSHDAIVENTDGDLSGHYKKFSKGITNMEKQQAELGKLTDEIQAAGQPFFVKWEQDLAAITSEDLRERSEERMKETRKRFDQTIATCNEVKASFDPILGTLRDHATYLANDLNVEAGRSLAKDSKKLGEKVSDLRELAQKTITSAKAFNESVATRIQAQPASQSKEK